MGEKIIATILPATKNASAITFARSPPHKIDYHINTITPGIPEMTMTRQNNLTYHIILAQQGVYFSI